MSPLTVADLSGFSPAQQAMLYDLLDSIRAAVELGQLTAAQAAEVLDRLAGKLRGKR